MAARDLTRREFIELLARLGVAAGAAGCLLSPPWPAGRFLPGAVDAVARTDLDELIRQAPLARYWIAAGAAGENDCLKCHADGEADVAAPYAHKGRQVKCLLCAQECLIADGERGRCRARVNVGGELRTLVYGRPITSHIDPIEKKPFYHFLPGAQAFSLATSGCPLRCRFCQNWEISQARPEDYETRVVPPASVANGTRDRGVPVIAFTYNEPTVFTEYLTDIARAGRERGLRSVLVSCGIMRPEPLAEMCEVLDAVKIDLKGYSPDFYRNVCDADLEAVLRSIEQVARSGVHLELVNLVVPTLNDDDAMLHGLAAWVVDALGPDVPVHFTRFHPEYKLRHLPPTPVATLERARGIAIDHGLKFAYVGNVPGHAGNHTMCPGCGRILIRRKGFSVEMSDLERGRCKTCGERIAGVWS
ncbi:AmmeMemoRadiSam system radical SAM enzyme [bacterium]|nr:AmmeMemoRadiSam system radical SAM enzyme [bacterium]MBU1495090.1 AmmeMemoRadiSam system radical SAM enzyme [Actinomycetota bacterium]MBU1676369.1 AmmeMemoRadiSam system radical SAM enzyme [bacterium]